MYDVYMLRLSHVVVVVVVAAAVVVGEKIYAMYVVKFVRSFKLTLTCGLTRYNNGFALSFSFISICRRTASRLAEPKADTSSRLIASVARGSSWKSGKDFLRCSPKAKNFEYIKRKMKTTSTGGSTIQLSEARRANRAGENIKSSSSSSGYHSIFIIQI
ncbi:hypothetical protein FF38_08087 [Lucilia cuprina]|uniref:Uncharacterized protein n=1 Tax=Lucilia cuprina TaxID=7375 RepID=A0A0L0C614_LUCCU|nr:hypothetical protein FF38_08087 [Lucilia cuprina]